MSQATQEFSQTQDSFVTNDGERAVQPWGRLVAANDRLRNYDLTQDEYVIGRNNSCDIVVSDTAAVSNRHCRIYRDGANFYVEDLSTNGTFIDERRVLRSSPAALNNDSVISLAVKKQPTFVFQDLQKDCTNSTDCPALNAQYILLRQLGSGACGVVRFAIHKVTGGKYAVKIVAKRNLTGRGKTDLMEEAAILKSIDHPFVISMHEVFESPTAIYFVLEYANGGELFAKLEAGRFLEEEARYLFAQILLAVQYLHDKGIVHRDLKPENLLLNVVNRRTIVKITDFGLARHVEGSMRTMCGTLTYLAPEVLRGARDNYTNAVDCWSLGVILYVCLCGFAPFNEGAGGPSLTDQILNGMYNFGHPVWRSVPERAIDLVRRLLVVDPRKRYSVDEALAHDWIKDEAQRIRGELLAPPSDAGAMPPPASLPSQRLKQARERETAAPPDGVDDEAAAKRPRTDAVVCENTSVQV